MEVITPAHRLNNLKHLPGFAAYLLSEKLEELVQKQIELTFVVDVPLLRFFSFLTDEERIAITRDSIREILTYLQENRAEEQINHSMDLWQKNQLPVVDKGSIEAEDITLLNYVRKKSLVHFVGLYTQEVTKAIELIDEIDFYVIQSITRATNLYINMLKERLEENSHFIQKVAETIPGAVYVFDQVAHKGVYANNKLKDVIGYDQSELNEKGDLVLSDLIHEDDRPRLSETQKALVNAKDPEVLVCKYRVKNKEGKYTWLSSYESVFKRHEDGTVWQTIGIALNVDAEQKAVDNLTSREQQLVETQNIADLGNYYWDFEGINTSVSQKALELLEASETDRSKFMERVHPNDREKVTEAIKLSLETGLFNCEYRVVTSTGTRHIWGRGLVEYKNGEPKGMRGTVMDITEKSQLLANLAQAEERYKQAEALTHIGNYELDLETDKIKWSDEMYRIWEIDNNVSPNIEGALQKVHSADRDLLRRSLKECKEQSKGFDIYFRLIMADGRTKIIHSRAKVTEPANDQSSRIIGTDQDVTEKQNLIRSLEENQRLYKQAQEMAKMGNFSWNIQTNQVYWSDEVYKIYEREEDEPIRFEDAVEPIDEIDKPLVQEAVAATLSSKQGRSVTYSITTKSGQQKFITLHTDVLLDRQGEVSSIIGTAQDVSEQLRTQIKLKESQTFVQKITDATPSIIALYNVTTGHYNFVSQGIEKLLGFTPEEAMKGGSNFFKERIHPDDLEMVMEKNRTALKEANASVEKNAVVLEFTCRMKTAEDTYRWFHTYGTVFDLDADEKVAHILNITLDVTEQKEAYQIIKEQEHFIQQIADASPTILYLFDVATQSIAYINRETFFVLGYLPEEMIEMGNGVTEKLYHPADVALLPARQQSSKGFQQLDSMIQYECRLKNKAGNYHWLLVREIVFKTDKEGNITQIIGAALDINKRKDMERTILQKTLQLEQSNASLEEFAYVASHDLKEPLRKISTFGDRLVATQNEMLNAEGRVYLRKIVEASQRMQNMISDLLSISMISGNSAFEPYSLQSILEETLQTLEYKIEQQGAVVRFTELPTIKIVPSQFRQLFQNLISNSLKFVREGVQPVVSLKCEEVAPDEVSHYQVNKSGTYLRLVFTDNGIGFESEYAQKIFAIFHRLHGRSEYEGSGIGLAICKKIVEHHGGVIFAEGAPEKGAVFTIILPA